MVNETNKSQETLENEQLGERLAASNHELANMQAEHRQLLEEMEQLRKRAEMLQHIREQQEYDEENQRLEQQQNLEAKTETQHVQEENSNANKSGEELKSENNAENNSEEADYIKEKLAEIARLKAQFKRVQHMINTTELIEKHISKNQADENPLKEETTNSGDKVENVVNAMSTTRSPVAVTTAPDPELCSIPEMPVMADLNAAATSDEKEQLILTMLNMFQDFSSDLKSQADNLRTERERIKELKESIIRSRREQPK